MRAPAHSRRTSPYYLPISPHISPNLPTGHQLIVVVGLEHLESELRLGDLVRGRGRGRVRLKVRATVRVRGRGRGRGRVRFRGKGRGTGTGTGRGKGRGRGRG